MKKYIINTLVMFAWMTMLVSNNLLLCLIGTVIFFLHVAHFVGERELEEEEKRINQRYKASNI